MWTAIFPIWARIAIIAAALGAIWVIGDVHGRKVDAAAKDQVIATRDATIAQDKLAFAARVKASDDALIAANAENRGKEQAAAVALFKADEQHSKELTHEQDRTAAAVAAYRAGTQRMRVDLAATADAGRCGAVPGAATAAAGRDGPATGELSGEAAAGVESVGGDANKVVLQLQHAQDYARVAYATCGPQTAAGGPR